MFTYEGQAFINNDEPTFVWGGEFHYFRVPKTEWKDRLDKIKKAGFNMVSTYIPWIWHEQVEGHIDLYGDTSPERDLKAFLDQVKDSGLWLLVRPGPYVMAETVNSGLPMWLFEKYPEIRAEKEDGTHHPSQGLVSYLHPTYLKYVDRWYEQVFNLLTPYQQSHGGPIVMIQYDNEVGMFHWVTGQGDYSAHTLSLFEDYLKDNFEDVCFHEVLKSYQDFGSYMDAYRKKETSHEASFVINHQYKLFFRIYIKTYLEKLIDIARSYGATELPVVNVHGFSQTDYSKRGIRYPVGLSQLYETAKIKDVVMAGDYYVGNIVPENFFDVVLANVFTKAIQPKEQPLFSAEFQGGFQNGVPRLQPTTHDLKTRLTISNGMNAINYYMFVGGENFDEIGLISRRHDWQSAIGTDGSLRRHYDVIKHIVDVQKTYGKALLEAKPKTDTTLAFDANYYMTEFKNIHDQNMANHLTHARQSYLYNGIGKSLIMNNITLDGLDLLADVRIDVLKHPTLFAFSLEWMDQRSQAKLKTYVEQGGKLFIWPEIPVKDLDDQPCTVLKDAIGVDIKEKVYGKRVKINSHDSVNCHYAQTYDVKEGFATLDLDHQKVTGFKKTVGKGLIYVFGMAIKSDWDYIDEVLKEVFMVMDIENIDTPSEWLHVSVRHGEKGSFVFIHNFEEFTKQTKIMIDGKAICDDHLFELPFKKGLILPLNWQVKDDFRVAYATTEIIDQKIHQDEIHLTIRPTVSFEKMKVVGDYQLIADDRLSVNENVILIQGLSDITLKFIKE